MRRVPPSSPPSWPLFDEVQRHLVAKGLKVATGTIVDATKAGDICVQRGTMHAWVAKGSEPAVFAFVLIDAEPVEKGGKKLATHYPTR